MKVSIVIPTFNGGTLLLECINSILQQQTQDLFEIIIIDSESYDGSIKKIRCILEERRVQFKIISIQKINFKHGNSRNKAIEACSGEIIVLLTQDAIPSNKFWLKNLVSNFDFDLEIAGVFGRHQAHESHPSLIHRDIENHFLCMAEIIERKINDIDEYNRNEKLRQKLHFFSNNNAAIRKCVWELVPFPDVSYGEDQTWAKKVLEKGYKIFYCSKALVYHSHNYGFFEIFNRTTTEIKYFKRYFGYNLYRSPLGSLKTFTQGLFGDLCWLNQNRCFSFSNLSYSCKSNLGANLARLYCFINKRSL